MSDLHGQALLDYCNRAPYKKLWIHNSYGPKEEMPVSHYFRGEAAMPLLEQIALRKCTGKVLDIGAGAGSHALLLQQKGLAVTALEISPKAAEVMQKRGVKEVVVHDVYTYALHRYNTLLLLMNGIGLTGTLAGLRRFLQQTKTLLLPRGQIIFDSSDVAYLYNGDPPANGEYYGEISYQYEYKKQKTEWFKWLYVDQQTMQTIAATEGFAMEVLFEDEFDQYLARLMLLDN